MAMRDEEVNMLELSTFMHGELKADVFKKDNSYGCRFYDAEGDKICVVIYPVHIDQLAEYADDNYVFVIKTIGV